jgi:hypothetical protein
VVVSQPIPRMKRLRCAGSESAMERTASRTATSRTTTVRDDGLGYGSDASWWVGNWIEMREEKLFSGMREERDADWGLDLM